MWLIFEVVLFFLMRNSVLTILLTLLVYTASVAKVRLVGIDPVNGIVAVKNMYADTQDLSKFWVSYKGMEVQLSSMKLETGAVKCPPKAYAFFSGFDLGFDSGYVALFDLRYNQTISTPASLVDYIQWGGLGNTWSARADTTKISGGQKVWDKDSMMKTLPPFSFIGGGDDRGKQFWQSFKLPQLGLRFVAVCPSLDLFAIKNTGSSNIDLGKLFVCSGLNCSDSLKNQPIQLVKGNMDIAKYDTSWFTGLPLGDTAGNLSLFLPLNRHDTVNLLDYVGWGSHQTGYGHLAHSLRWWDTTATVKIAATDTVWYTGNFARSPLTPQYWQVRKDSIGDTSQVDTLGWLFIQQRPTRVYYSNGLLHIEGQPWQIYDELDVYTMWGQTIARRTMHPFNLPIPLITPKGIYLLRIRIGSNLYAYKFWVD